jgi:hypothetical protein
MCGEASFEGAGAMLELGKLRIAKSKPGVLRSRKEVVSARKQRAVSQRKQIKALGCDVCCISGLTTEKNAKLRPRVRAKIDRVTSHRRVHWPTPHTPCRRIYTRMPQI